MHHTSYLIILSRQFIQNTGKSSEIPTISPEILKENGLYIFVIYRDGILMVVCRQLAQSIGTVMLIIHFIVEERLKNN